MGPSGDVSPDAGVFPRPTLRPLSAAADFYRTNTAARADALIWMTPGALPKRDPDRTGTRARLHVWREMYLTQNTLLFARV